MFVPPAEETIWAAAWWVKEAHELTTTREGVVLAAAPALVVLAAAVRARHCGADTLLLNVCASCLALQGRQTRRPPDCMRAAPLALCC